ncbi:hypothetical protein NQ318_008952 [Aromia moschata]|uniref:Nuclear receptor domain-containing protein n=1 Tax=Aromia moschata TaxID=1265417 RepID=A0AAV8ZCV1_9CUCU|nr:hypothetical protein NQ318_008952 [Aromia moschata]
MYRTWFESRLTEVTMLFGQKCISLRGATDLLKKNVCHIVCEGCKGFFKRTVREKISRMLVEKKKIVSSTKGKGTALKKEK